jgi:hypothetical protein
MGDPDSKRALRQARDVATLSLIVLGRPPGDVLLADQGHLLSGLTFLARAIIGRASGTPPGSDPG